MKGLNLANFSKIKEDKDTVHMKSKDGHVIMLAVKALPKIQREQLKRIPMAQGGTLTGGESKLAKGVANTSPGGGNQGIDKSVSYDNSGSTWDKLKALLPSGGPSSAEASPQDRYNGGRIQNYDEGTPNEPIKAEAPQSSAPPININVSPSAPIQSTSTPQDAASMPPNVSTTPENVNLLSKDQTLNVPAAVNLQQQAAREQQAVDAAKGAGAADIEKGYIDRKKQQIDQIQNNYKDLKGQTDDFKTYISGNPINEKHYLENMSAGNKVANAFGLLFGGFKQGYSGGSNPAMDYLNGQIQRDIDAQKSRGEQQRTVLGAYQHLYGEGVVANNLTNVSMNDLYVHKAQMLAAQLGTPQAKATADAFAAQKAIENNKLLLETAARKDQLGGGSGNAPQAPNQENKVGPAVPMKQQAPPTAQANPPQEKEGLFSQFINGRLGMASAAQAPQGEMQREEPGILSKVLNELKRPEPKEQTNFPTYSILSPNAERKLHGTVQYGSEESRQDYPSVLDQYTKAQQAEKVLNGPEGNGVGGIHDLMQRMYTESGSGNYVYGLGPHIRNSMTGALGAIPEIGPALAGATKIVPRTQAQREYDSNKSVMETDLANALQGLVAPTDINKIVEANLPAYGDSPEDIEHKTQAIVNMVIKGAKTSQLKSYKMVK